MNKFKLFMKKYGYYCMVGVLVLALAITVGIVAGTEENTLNTNSNPAENPVISVNNPEVLSFTLPMENPSIVKDYSGTDIMWNSTYGWWEAHEGMDLTSENSLVFAIADGEVLSVTEEPLEGTKVIIKHSDELQSVYSSLNSDLKVKAGDKVKKGDQIGTASDSAGNETATGAHLHFELIEDGNKIDPNNYLELEPK